MRKLGRGRGGRLLFIPAGLLCCFRRTMAGAGGVLCFLGAYAFYLVRRYNERSADALRSVTRVNRLNDLSRLLDTGSKVVSIAGRIGCNTPLNCQRSGLRGVILEETVDVLFMKPSDDGRWWTDSREVFSTTEQVPWFVDDGTGRVYVVGARPAWDISLTIASEVFDSGCSQVSVAVDRLQDLKILGYKRVEKILPMGTSLTVVGEVVKDEFGNIQIQSPQRGPFYVSRKNIDELLTDLGGWARWTHYVSMGLVVFGVCLLAIEFIGDSIDGTRPEHGKEIC